MRQNDPEFIKILNIIRRGQRLVLQARKDGNDTHLAEELINEARFALKLNKREEAIDYAKKCIIEVIKAKREKDREDMVKEGALEGLTKEELREKCKEMGIECLGLKSELIERIRQKLKDEGVGVEKELLEKTTEEETPDVETTTEKPEEKPSKEALLQRSGVEALAKSAWNPAKTAEELTPGLSYLVEEKRPEKLFHIYKALLKKGKSGLVISRTNPKILARSYNLSEEGSVWLTGKEVQGEIVTVLPILEFIMSICEDFVETKPEGILLIDGLEYLLTNNKFNSVLRFIRQLVDNVSQTECILMVALSPDALDSTEVTLLEKDLLPLNYVE
jgi:hypothetical protein